ncbi:hypothetical protein ZWY2020_013259 [Hordeum vulgare]|nr:hypothetical protein ZWY2020_013259 [Hordeum vulgare]
MAVESTAATPSLPCAPYWRRHTHSYPPRQPPSVPSNATLGLGLGEEVARGGGARSRRAWRYGGQFRLWIAVLYLVMEPCISFRRPMAELLPFPLLPWLLLLLLTCFSPFFVHSMESSTSGCSSSNISIPYPFGVSGHSPSPAQGFEVICHPGSSGPRLPIGSNSISILNISLLDGYVTILASAASRSPQCRGKFSSFSLEGTNFTFSDTRNKFTAVGCNMVAMMVNGTSGYSGGCASFCSTNNSIVDGACSGVACCQAPVPKGLKKLYSDFTNINITASLSKYTSACAEAFIVDQNSYAFTTADLMVLNNSNKSPPQYRHVVLEWSIDGGSCEEASRSASYACKENSYCYNSSNGIGYRCNCTKGFQGNPYLQGTGGCQDIDECLHESPCTHSCINVKGSFNCTCPSGMSGDGLKGGYGCNGIGTLQISIVVGLSLLLLLLLLGGSVVVGGCWLAGSANDPWGVEK